MISEPATPTGQALHVVELQAENVMRLKAVRIAPEPGQNVVILGGDNEQGKSTVLRAIEMAICGAKTIPDVPIREGEGEARIVLDLGDLVVERRFYKSKGATKTELVVRNADGVQQASPQAILDKLHTKVAFNPMEFANQKPDAQLATLKRIVGLDFATEDAQRAKLYAERTDVGRRITDAEVRYTSAPQYPGNTPDAEVVIADLLAKKDTADAENAKRAGVRRAAADAQTKVEAATEAVRQAKRRLDEAQEAFEIANNARYEAIEAASYARVAADDLPPDVDTAPIVEAIRTAEETNRFVRSKKERAKLEAELKGWERQKAELTAKIDAIDSAKVAKMNAAKWPIPGLGFSDDGVTLNGLPFEQASKAQRMKASLAIGAEQNPTLRVLLLQDASLLDSKSMAVVREFAADNNMQIWIERVGSADPGAIIIEDGEIATTTEKDGAK
jgi:hypothetical protein